MNSPQIQLARTIQNNNAVVFVAALALGGYAVYTVGDLQTVIYAVCGAYMLRLLMQNPEIISQLQDQLSILHTGRSSQPVMQSPHSAHPSHPEMTTMPMMSTAQGPSPVSATTAQPRLETNFLEQTGYQPLRQPPQRAPTMSEYEMGSPTTPIPSYTQFNAPPSIRLPTRTASRASNYSDEYQAPRTHFGSFSQSDNGTITGDRFNLLNAGDATPTPRPGMDPRLSVVSTFSAFPEPVNNPFGSYAHYDAGTIGGERLVQRVEVPAEYTVPADFNLSERIAAPPQRPESSRSLRSDTAPTPTRKSTEAGNTMSRSSSTKPSYVPFALRTDATKQEYLPKRQHRKPTVAARVGEVAAPGGGIAPARTSSAGSSERHSSPKRFGSPLVESPQVTSPSGYDSDSSHASSSSGHSSKKVASSNGHGRTESTTSSLGLPTYEKHATTIFTLVPKRPGYVPQIQAILKASRQAWLALPGSVTHEVGLDNSTGSVVVVETYETTESMNDFEQSKEREAILERLKTFIEETKTTVVRLPASSAATRVVR